jgi:hypothetical protein
MLGGSPLRATTTTEAHVTPLDQYIHSQVGPTLEPGERILHWSTMRRQPGLWLQILLIGGLLLALMTKVYLVALTNRRLILIRTKAGFFSGTPKPMSLGIEQYDVRTIKNVSTGGFANNRSMTFETDSGKITLRISPWFKSVSGTKAFFEEVPALINSGQLFSPQVPALASHQGQYGAPPQQYGAPPQLGPGAPVLVLAQDGNRYPGTVVQLHGEHCLCAMQNGQFWFPASSLAPG